MKLISIEFAIYIYNKKMNIMFKSVTPATQNSVKNLFTVLKGLNN